MKQSGLNVKRQRGRSFVACVLALIFSFYSLPLSVSEAFGVEGAVTEGQDNGQQVETTAPEESESTQVGIGGGENANTDTSNSAAKDDGNESSLSELNESKLEQQPSQNGSEESALADEIGRDAAESPDGKDIYDGVSDEEIAEVLSMLDESPENDGVASFSLSGGSAVKTFGGATMFETAVAEAKAAYSTSDTVILAGPGESWVDALAAAGLAGALDCPILFVQNDSLHAATKQALKDLSVKNAIVLGGSAAISDGVVNELVSVGVTLKKRLGGADCYETQMKIYEYGLENGLWNSDMAIVATGGHFGDALSVSPVVYAKKAPIFLVDNGELRSPQKNALSEASKSGKFSTTVIVGGEAAVSKRTKGFLDRMSTCARLWGATQYETSAEIAKWAVNSQGFTWNNAAFTTGLLPYDALAGSVLQGASKSVMLLVGDTSSATIKDASMNQASITGIRFFGGTAAIAPSLRTYIMSCVSEEISYKPTGISLVSMANLEGQPVGVVNPDQYDYEDDEFYQFAILNEGYSDSVTASQLNSFIARYGADGKLAGMGQVFIDAANVYGTNEVYLLSHAILESGWGKSNLAMGYYYDGSTEIGGKTYPAGTYYNFFGIGAYDSSPLSGGRAAAIINGWNTPKEAIMGAAEWISDGYLNNTYGQNTLYKMRWNYIQAASSGAVWKQYATSPTWATGIANVMSNFYAYAKIDKVDSGLTFVVPVYS